MAFVAALVLAAIVQVAQASTWTVNRTADPLVGIAANCTSNPNSNFCSLRDAVAASANGDTVHFSVGNNAVITLKNGRLTLATNLTMDGSGSPGLRIDTNYSSQVFFVNSGVTAAISNLIVSRGATPGDGGGIYNNGSLTLTGVLIDQCAAGASLGTGKGGAIYNTGQLNLTDSTLSANVAHSDGGGIYNTGNSTITHGIVSGNSAASNHGGGIYNSGTLNASGSAITGNSSGYGAGVYGWWGGTVILTSSTLSGNSASAVGGGVLNDADPGPSGTLGTLTLTNSTVSGNSASTFAGGIHSAGTLTLVNDTLAGNSGGGIRVPHGTISATNTLFADTCSLVPGSLVLDSGNLSDSGICAGFTPAAIKLGPLQDNGGPTLTMLPGPDSSAIDHVACASAPATDQRGIARPHGGQCDVGAVEVVTCYVRYDAAGANNGSSWADAYTGLQSALANNQCDDDWVARGIYKPTTTSDRTISFDIPPHVSVLGGFAGSETAASQRDAIAHPTVLSADIDDNDTGSNGVDDDTTHIVGNNSYHVVVLDGTTAAGPIAKSTLLDGVTITGGDASGTAPDDSGGGLHCNGSGAGHACSPTLSNLVFSGNRSSSLGGGLYNDGNGGGDSSPLVSATTFIGNHSANGGGAFDDTAATGTPAYVNDTFSGNSADYGAAVYTRFASGSGALTLTNVTASGNLSTSGGAIAEYCVAAGSPAVALTNVILWGDTGGPSGSEELVVSNCAALPTFKNSIVMGSGGSSAWKPAFGTDGLGNLDVDPMLGQLQDNGGSAPTMLPGSPAIDAGLDSACNAAPVSAVDQRGVARPVAAHCDIGAVEASALILSLTDNSLYATGGQDNYYVVSLVNSSATDTFSGIQMRSTSSSALDASNMYWNCVPVDPASVCSTGSGMFNDIATLSPSAVLVWVVRLPVLAGSNDPAATFRVVVSGAGAANDSDIITIFRSGFEAP